MTTEHPRSEKVAVVEEVSARLASAQAVFVTEYRGMSVGQLANLRRTLRPAGGEYKVYKNTLARRAASEHGLDGLADLLVGPSGLIFASGDIVGLFFHNYPSFTGQTRNAVFGRLAGKAAVAEN